jgi:hypothetical protein
MAMKKALTGDQILKNAARNLAGVEIVPFASARDLPGTVRPRATATADVNVPKGHISVSELAYDLTEGQVAQSIVCELIETFKLAVRKQGWHAQDFAPLPHPRAELVQGYTPLRIDGIPARMVIHYSFMYQAFVISIDAQLRELAA